MSISAAVGYAALLVLLGFAVGALFWAADKCGLLDFVKKRRATRVRSHRASRQVDSAKLHPRQSAAHRNKYR
jgi:hypothetical protein